VNENQLRRQGIWSIDAKTSLQSILDSPECPLLLRRSLMGALSWQARTEMVVHRTLTAPRIAPQWLASLLALGASATVSNDDGSTQVLLRDLMQHRPLGEISILHVPLPVGAGGRLRWGEARVARTPSDEPIVMAVAAVEMEKDIVRKASVALTGVWPETVRLAEAASRLVGNPLNEEIIGEVVQAVKEEVAPKGDFLGSEEYRRAMASVLTRRALTECQR
jgi:CO/xanthine dehydrogenase FAD-binding subunit